MVAPGITRPHRLGHTSPEPSASARTARSTSSARPESGTRCGRFAFMRAPGTVHARVEVHCGPPRPANLTRARRRQHQGLACELAVRSRRRPCSGERVRRNGAEPDTPALPMDGEPLRERLAPARLHEQEQPGADAEVSSGLGGFPGKIAFSCLKARAHPRSHEREDVPGYGARQPQTASNRCGGPPGAGGRGRSGLPHTTDDWRHREIERDGRRVRNSPRRQAVRLSAKLAGAFRALAVSRGETPMDWPKTLTLTVSILALAGIVVPYGNGA